MISRAKRAKILKREREIRFQNRTLAAAQQLIAEIKRAIDSLRVKQGELRELSAVMSKYLQEAKKDGHIMDGWVTEVERSGPSEITVHYQYEPNFKDFEIVWEV